MRVTFVTRRFWPAIGGVERTGGSEVGIEVGTEAYDGFDAAWSGRGRPSGSTPGTGS